MRNQFFVAVLWIFLFALGMPPTAFAALEEALVPPPPSTGETPGDAEAKLRATLEKQIAQQRDEIKRLQGDAQQLTRTVQEAPAQIAVMRKQIEAVGQLVGRDKLEKLNLEDVTVRLNNVDAQQHALELTLNDVYGQIANQQDVPTQARIQITDLQAALDDAENRIKDLQGANDGIASLKLQATEVERDKILAARKVQEIQLDGYQKLLELYTANRDLLTGQLTAAKEIYSILRSRYETLSKDEVARQQAAFAELERTLAGMPAPVIDAALTNKKFHDQQILLQESLRQTLAWDKDFNEVTQELKQRYQIAQQQLDIGGYNQFYMEHVRYVSRNLRPLLNEYGDESTLRNALVDARAKQFSYDDQLRELRNRADKQKKINKLLDKLTPEQRNNISVISEIQRIYSQREDLLAKLSEVNGNYVVALTTFDLSRKNLQSEERKFVHMLNQKMVWLHSSPPMSWDVLLRAPRGAYYFFINSPWAEIPHYLNEYRLSHPIRTAQGVLLFALLMYVRKRLLARLDHMAKHIGRVGRDKFRYTVEALFVTILTALPSPLVIALIGWDLRVQSPFQSFAFTLGDVCLRLSYVVMVLTLLPVLMRKNGLALLHFRWSERVLEVIRKNVPWFIAQLPIYGLGMYIAYNAGDQRSVFLFGRVLLLLANLMLAWTFWRMLRPGTGLIPEEKHYHFPDVHWRQRFIWMPLIIGIPVLCALLVILGYDFTVVTVARNFYVTLFAGFGILVMHQVLMRWFAVQERQIALDQALARRAAAQAAKNKESSDVAADGVVDVDALDEVNLETISERNRALLKVVASVTFIAVLWQLWSDMAPAFDVLDQYVLWKVSGVGSSGALEQVPITLWRFLNACVVLVLTVVAGRNLPGLVEVVLLQRFQLEASIRFAITTVARYCIYAVGIMLGSELLGIAWEKVGWLVAALGVGLGFGLQEIFANFTSGLIILIERPIRIGDAVTIDGKSGMVTQIKMRATTITDWDQKELIIPNKTIMTNQLVNWTLSDTVTRVVFPIGVAYGTDPNLVVRLLLGVAQQHPQVMKTPAPGAFFLGFGESTLNFELRVFLADFTRRTPTVHEINLEINRVFIDNDIEIAYRQLDVRVKQFPELPVAGLHLRVEE